MIKRLSGVDLFNGETVRQSICTTVMRCVLDSTTAAASTRRLIRWSFVSHRIDSLMCSWWSVFVFLLVSIFTNCWRCAASYFHLLQAAHSRGGVSLSPEGFTESEGRNLNKTGAKSPPLVGLAAFEDWQRLTRGRWTGVYVRFSRVTQNMYHLRKM